MRGTFDDLADAGPHPDQDIDDARAGGVEADILHEQARARLGGRGHEPEGRARDVARHAEIPGFRDLPALDGDAGFLEFAARRRGPVPNILPAKLDQKILEHPLGMVARTRGLDDRRLAFGEQSGEQDGALHLGARDRKPVGDPRQRASLDNERGTLFLPLGGKPRAHFLERRNHAAHRALRQRRVACQPAPESLRREQAGHQPHRRAGVPAVDVFGGRLENAAVALDDDGARFGRFDGDPQLAHRAGRAAAVLALQAIGDRAAPVGNCREEDRAVRDAFVAGDSQLRFDRGAAADFDEILCGGLHSVSRARRVLASRRNASIASPSPLASAFFNSPT